MNAMLQRHTGHVFTLVFLICLASAASAEQVTITGQIVGPDDQPVAEAQVLLKYRAPSYETPTKRAITHAEGRFSFGCDVLDLTSPIYVAAHKPGLAVDWAAVKPGEGITLRLGADPVTFVGTVKQEPEGNPIAGAEAYIELLRRMPGKEPVTPKFSEDPHLEEFLSMSFFLNDKTFLRATTDETGRFEIPDLPPDQQIRVTVLAEGRERWSTGAELVSTGGQDIEVVLPIEVAILGRVLHEGQPVSGVKLICVPTGPANYVASTTSNDDGTYEFKHLGPGTYWIILVPPEGLTGCAVGPMTLERGDRAAETDLVLIAGGLVSGEVTDAPTGQPVAGVSVSAYGPGRPRETGRAYYAKTDDSGTYTLRLPGGASEIYCSVFWHARYAKAEPGNRTVQVVEGEMVTGVDFVLQPRPRVRGQVLLPDGQPAAGVGVRAIGVRHRDSYTSTSVPSLQFKDQFRTETDDQGYFELEFEQVSGNIAWALLACNFQLGLAGMVVLEGAEVPEAPVQIVIGPGGYLRTKVVDMAGQPLPDMEAHASLALARGYYHGVGRVRSDEEGHIEIGPLPAGVGLRAGPAGEAEQFAIGTPWFDQGEVVLAPGEVRELPPLEVNLAGRSLKVWVGDEQQQPVNGTLVFAPQIEEPVVVDESGYLELTGLPTRGKVAIVAVHPTVPLFAAEEIDPDWGFRANLVLRPLGTATGRIVDEQGRPLAGVKVNVGRPMPGPRWDFGRGRLKLLERLGKNSFYWETMTDEQGNWGVKGLVGGADYGVSVWAPGARGGREQTTFTAIGGETVDLGEIVLQE